MEDIKYFANDRQWIPKHTVEGRSEMSEKSRLIGGYMGNN